ncbi:MAG: hypothetical protein VX278_09450, partial [Myxococcota bacterium]|nr:hypothetical protein [Myxococcota bacterium]
MSIDLYTDQSKHFKFDQGKQVQPMSGPGFSSIMDVMNQNYQMQRGDNDAFEVPITTGEVLEEPEAAPVVEENVKAVVEVVEKEAQPTIELKEQVVVEQKTAPVEVIVETAPVTMDFTPVLIEEPLAELEVEEVVADWKEVISPRINEVKHVHTEDVSVQTDDFTPIVEVEEPIVIEVDRPDEVSFAIEEVLHDVLERPQMVSMPDRPEITPKEKTKDTPLKRILQTNVYEEFVPEIKESVEPSKDLIAKRVKDVPSDSKSLLNLLEEAPEVTFIKYMEEEVQKPTFTKTSAEQLDLPSNMKVGDQETPIADSTPAAVATAARDGGGVKSVTRAEAVQSSSLQDNNLKEEPELPKVKVKKQSFAQLLKEAKEKAENFEPKFNANILRHLEVHIRDPAGVIQLDIAQEEAAIHVRAVVPTEAMSDLQLLGQDMGEALQDMGLELGSYELRSREDEGHENGI